MNTFQLKCFLTVTETLNFARAAQLLNITQPAVTHQIRSLENELNVRLFKRTTRNVELTHEGQLFINDASGILSISRRAVQRFNSPSSESIQSFAIGSHNHATLFMLSGILREMASSHSGLRPHLKAVPFQFLYRLLEDEDVDVIIGFKETDTKSAPYIYKELTKIPFVCICSEEKKAASLAAATPDNIKDEKLILSRTPVSSSGIDRIQRRFAENRPISDLHFCESAEESMVLAQSGFGIAVMPELFIPPYFPLARIPVADAEPASFGAYYKTLRGNPLLREFISLAESAFTGS